MSEAAILDVVKKNFQDHLILGEEGGIIGDSSSDYLWCIDPLGIAYRSPIHGCDCSGACHLFTSQTL